MAKINIIIKGVAMSYQKGDGLWKVLFPFGECHKIKFKETENDPGIALAGKNRRIRITTENAESAFEIGDDYNDFLDLTADYSHANGVKMRAGWEERAVLMTIENARLSAADYTDDAHLMVRGNTVTLAPKKIGYSYKAEIKSEKIIIEVDNHPEFPKAFNQDCTLIFDNDCEQGEARKISDFEMVYNVVEDAATKNEQFVVAKLSADMTVGIVAGTKFEGEAAKKFKDSFEGGLPCHGVRISKIENLV
jgi:hypothetical protein